MPLTVFGFVGLYFSGIYMAFTRHPVWGLLPYCLALYLSPAHNWFGSYLPDLRWSLLASICAVLSIFFNGSKLPAKTHWLKTGPARIILCYSLWMWIQYPWALSKDMHIEGTVLITKYLLLYYIIYKVLNTDADFFKFFLFNIFGSYYVSTRVLAYSLSGRVEGVGGPGMSDSNTLGMHMSLILIFAAMMLLKKNTIFANRLYWRMCQFAIFVSAVYIANAVVQTISRSAVLGLVAGGMLLIVIKHRTVKKKFYLYLVFAFAGLIYFTPYTFWERLNTITEAVQGEEVEASAYSRLVIASAQWKMFKENIFGNGHRGTQVLSPYYLGDEYLATLYTGGRGRSSHCTFLTSLVEQGVPGALLYLMMVFWGIKTIFSYRKKDPVMYLYFMGVSASLAAIFVSGIFVDYLKSEVQIYCFAMLASLKEFQMRQQYQESLSQNPTAPS
ncbi:O-antigen ligase family protein [uncultured Desulfobacter sp.]|uniref:O-antigen ligase family protein n=1 Tax=uncultured Desulfobacter sp. TaxID=240139 RepID=UPI0029C6E44D|nr:O-antigen ligase family protein [uncultured Desulfobacter sp.]